MHLLGDACPPCLGDVSVVYVAVYVVVVVVVVVDDGLQLLQGALVADTVGLVSHDPHAPEFAESYVSALIHQESA